MAEEFYKVHKERPFFAELVQFITSGPVVAVVVEGRNAISAARTILGATDSSKAESGSIRGDYGLGYTIISYMHQTLQRALNMNRV